MKVKVRLEFELSLCDVTVQSLHWSQRHRDSSISDSNTTNKWYHWKTLFNSFLAAMETSSPSGISAIERLNLLFIYFSTRIYINISSCKEYETAISILEGIFVKKKNAVFASLLISTRRQQPEKNLKQDLQVLKTANRDSDFNGIDIRTNHHHHHHHHHVVPLARISLTLSRHFSLSFIAYGRFSGLHPVSSHSCCMYVRAGHPAFARAYVGVHRSTSLMSSSLLLHQCPACLVRLTWIFLVMGGRWPYSWCLEGSGTTENEPTLHSHPLSVWEAIRHHCQKPVTR